MKYLKEIIEDENDSVWKIIKKIKENSIVLEFGPSTGYMTQYLKNTLNCKVYIVEIDQEAYLHALNFAFNGVCGDISSFEWVDKFSNISFDYIIFADVLEHLINPAEVLAKAKSLLKEKGSVILSVPNIAHSDIILNLFNDRFEYTQYGLLDNTHVHFFAYNSLKDMCESSGYSILEEDATFAETFQTEQNILSESVDVFLAEKVSTQKRSQIYQYIFTLQINSLNNHILQDNLKSEDAYGTTSNFYFDEGKGFSEENKITAVSKQKDGLDVFEINIPQQIVGVRFDPCEHMRCILKNVKVSSNDYVLYTENLNGVRINEYDVFDITDPQIFIKVETNMEYLIIEAEILPLTLSKCYELLLMAENRISKQNTHIISLNNQLEQKSKCILLFNKALKLQNAHCISLNKQLDQKSKCIRLFNKALKLQNAHCISLNKQLDQYKEHFQDVSIQYENTQHELQIATDNFNIISGATFWKITKPCRIVLDLFKRFLKRNKLTTLFYKGVVSLKNKGIIITLRKIKLKLKSKKSINANEDYSIFEKVSSVDFCKSNEMVKYLDKHEKYYLDLNENTHIDIMNDDVMLIAFYLPQFHTFDENDKWWGRGFTEWTNVTKATPQFMGHYQPQLPIDVGFYDLSNINVIKRQVELAKKYGVYGFCFHYYWFAGKRLMEKPLDIFLSASAELNFPFCICWANENWTRRWDGAENDILMAQNHSDADDLACIKDICRYIRDKHYIKVNGKPLVIIYRADVLPNAKNTIDIWRKHCRDTGLGELHIVGAKTFSTMNPTDVGFDAGVEFPPHHLSTPEDNAKLAKINPEFSGKVYNMTWYLENKMYEQNSDANIYKSVFPSWDNTARKPHSGNVLHLEPFQYKKWLLKVMEITTTTRLPGDRLVFINAWNEWGEGAHLEPDRRYGYAYLEMTAKAIIQHRAIKPLLSVIAPAYNHEKFIEECLKSVYAQTYNNIELIVIDDCSSDTTPNIIKSLINTQNFFNKFKRIKFIENKINKGSSASINEGVSYAKGDYITIINTDDLYEKNRFDKIIDCLMDNNAEIGFSKVKIINKKNQIANNCETKYYSDLQKKIHNSILSEELLNSNLCISTGNLVFTKDLFIKLNGFKEFTYIHDWDFTLRASLLCEPIYVESTNYLYRLHDKNTFRDLEKDDVEKNKQVTEVLNEQYKRIVDGNFINQNFLKLQTHYLKHGVPKL